MKHMMIWICHYLILTLEKGDQTLWNVPCPFKTIRNWPLVCWELRNTLKEKNWSRNGYTVEPVSCPQDGPHLGTVLVPLCNVVPFSTKKRLIYMFLRKTAPQWSQNSSTFDKVEPFSTLFGKILENWLWYRFSKWYQFGQRHRLFLKHVYQSGTAFPNGSTLEPFWLHFFSVETHSGAELQKKKMY